jgi:RecA-family ATPase
VTTNGHGSNGHTNGHDPFFDPPPGFDEPEPHPGNGHGNPWIQRPWVYSEDPWQPMYLPELQDREVPRREWIADQWVPALETTGFSGAGGQGKTLVAMMLATAAVLGRHWFNIPLAPTKVFALLCEDRPNDVHIRQVNINRHYECDFLDLENLLVYPRRSHPRNRLMIFDRDGIGHTTPFFDQTLREVKKFGAQLSILDTRADLFLGDQNDEDQARSFVRLVSDRIAEETKGATVLLYQPSRAGMREGTGQSGSVQWNAAFRSGWYLEDKEAEGEEQPANPYARTLTRVKSNFALRDEAMELKWDAGVFVRTDKPISDVSGFRQQQAQRVFLAILAETRNAKLPVSNNPASRNYAPKFFSGRPAREGMKVADFEKAMDALFYQKKIKLVPHGRPDRGVFTIEISETHA